MVGNDDTSVLASSDHKLDAHYKIAVSAFSLEAVHDDTGSYSRCSCFLCPMAFLMGRIQSLDWIGGLDWNGLDWTGMECTAKFL